MKSIFLFVIFFCFVFSINAQQTTTYSNGISLKLSYEIPKKILSPAYNSSGGFDILYTNRFRNNYFEFGIGFRNFSPLSDNIHFSYYGGGTAQVSHLIMFPVYISRSGDINLSDNVKINIGANLGLYYSSAEKHVQYSGTAWGGTTVQALVGAAPQMGLVFTDEKKFRVTLQAIYNFYFPLEKEDPLFDISGSGYSPYTTICLGLKGTCFFPSTW